MANRPTLESALREFAAVFMRRSVHEFIRTMKEGGLSPSQLNTLMRLHYRGPCPISEVGDDLGVTAAAASQMVERLVQQGLIERGEDPQDRRLRPIRLTSHGKALIARGVEARVAWMESLRDAFGPKEHAQATKLLTRLTQAVRDLDSYEGPPESLHNPATLPTSAGATLSRKTKEMGIPS